MFKDSIKEICQQINDNFVVNSDIEGYIIGLEGPAYTFAQNAWHISMIVAAVVFAIIACYELYAQSVRTEGHGGPMGSAEVVFKVMFKVAVCFVVLQLSFDLLVGLFGTANDLTAAFEAPAQKLSKSLDNVFIDGDEVVGMIPDGYFNGFWAWIFALIVLLLSWIVKFFAWALIIIRVLQIYLYLIISPVPIATLCSNELSQIGKNFLKSFVAVCIQGALIYVVVQMFPGIVATVIDGGYIKADSVTSIMGISALYSITILVTLTGTQKVANRLCGAM